MKPSAFEIRFATSTREALEQLAEVGDEGRPLAGGQSLIPLLNFRMAQPEVLIDLGEVDELRYIRRDPSGGLRIGAMTTMSQLLESPLVRESHPVLIDTVRHIAHEPIRNRGTIGGSLAHMDPAAEMPALALLLGFELVATSTTGSRSIPAAEFIQSAYVTALDEGELLTEIFVPPMITGARTSVLEVAQRNGDFALAGGACVLAMDDAGVISSLRTVVFGSSTAPTSLRAVDELATGQVMTGDLALQIASEYARGITPMADRHGSADFRRHLTRVMATRVIREAAQLPLS